MRPRVTLFHNPTAGYERYSADWLIACLSDRGYEVSYVHAKDDDLERALRDPGDAVIVGGGDGTVGGVCKQLVGRGVPVGVLPLGTANNIATSLGVSGEPEDIIAGFDLSRTTPFDVGIIDGLDRVSVFLESAGFGLFPRLIRARENEGDEESREEELREAIREQIKIVDGYEPHRCKIELDADVIEDDFLLVELMNIPLAGPNLRLAPAADPGDRALDVALVTAADRDAFKRFLEASLDAGDESQWSAMRRARSIHVDWHGRHYHVDDEPQEADPPLRMSFDIRPAALRFLTLPEQ